MCIYIYIYTYQAVLCLHMDSGADTSSITGRMYMDRYMTCVLMFVHIYIYIYVYVYVHVHVYVCAYAYTYV